ncbi:MAG: hypothetical protein AAGG01_12015 [Planctomycetota bacterium]
MLSNLVFLEPLGLLGLIAPAVLILASLRRRPVPAAYLGTLRFFERVPESASEARERRVLPWLVAAAIALVLASLALARPGVAPVSPDGVAVALVVDRSPSMFLPVRLAGDSSSGMRSARDEAPGQTRMDAAIESFKSWAEEHEARTGEAVFFSFVGLGDELPRSVGELETPEAPDLEAPEPLWLAHDFAGAVWITDAAADVPDREHAGVFARGGLLVPGPVSMGVEESFVLDASGAVRVDSSLRLEGELLLDGDLPDAVVDLAEVWATERGLQTTATPSGRVLLHVEGPDAARLDQVLEALAEPVEVGRDGWQAQVRRAGRMSEASTLSPWLVGPSGARWIESAPGRVRFRFAKIETGPDDLAAFAVSLVQLFDQSKRIPSSVTSAEERAAAGAAVSEPPRTVPPYVQSAAAAGDQPVPVDREASARLAALLRAALAAGAGFATVLSLVLLARDR